MAKYKNHGTGACICLLFVFILSQSAWAITYEYDDLNRLIKVSYDNGAVITYAYDAAGNITSFSQTPSEKKAPEQVSTSSSGGSSSSAQAVLSLPAPGFIDLGTELTRAAFPVTNKYGQGTLVWEIGGIQYSSDARWITSIEPASGSTSDESMVLITASRVQLQPGVYNATLPVTSNGGDGSITIRMEVSQVAPAPECSSDADCDDGLYCNGSERCLSGVCAAGSKPCGDSRICNETTDTCWSTKIINAIGIRNKFVKPALKASQKVWLIVRCTESNHFNKNTSSISLASGTNTAKGISVDKSRSGFKLGQFIFIPLLIDKNATTGSGSVSIKSEIENRIEETITCGFEVF